MDVAHCTFRTIRGNDDFAASFSLALTGTPRPQLSTAAALAHAKLGLGAPV